MVQSSFVNPNGLPADDQISSARDLAILARALIREFPEYDYYWHLPGIRLGHKVQRNYNTLIGRYPGADGMRVRFWPLEASAHRIWNARLDQRSERSCGDSASGWPKQDISYPLLTPNCQALLLRWMISWRWRRAAGKVGQERRHVAGRNSQASSLRPSPVWRNKATRQSCAFASTTVQ